ncbi:hypothetical protein ACIBG8_36815 [Nonomuraea sp. NPDC050556]|uniref:hypothetical protein n=1 Tax=Nonomuraea sp. NPDC050556 TaxID=3364369 RepID=UPI0037AA77E5
MFDQILGLPAHPLIIHAAVMLTPLLALLAVLYAVLPRFRPYLAWAVVALAVAAPGAVFAAKESGESLRAARFAHADGSVAGRIATHQSFANPLLMSVIGLGVVALLLVFVRNKAASVVLSVVTVLLAGVAGYYVFRAGDSGARAVWGV